MILIYAFIFGVLVDLLITIIDRREDRWNG